MAFFTGAIAKLGASLVGLVPGMHGVILAASDDSADILQSDGAGAALTSDATAQASLASILAGMATGALQSALNALVATPGTPTPIIKSDDTVTTSITAKGIWVGGAGDLVVKGAAGGDARTIKVAAGYCPINCSRVMAATTATDLVGLS